MEDEKEKENQREKERKNRTQKILEENEGWMRVIQREILEISFEVLNNYVD